MNRNMLDVIISPIRSSYIINTGIINLCPYKVFLNENIPELFLEEVIALSEILNEKINLVFNDFLYNESPKLDLNLLKKYSDKIQITTFSVFELRYNIFRVLNFLSCGIKTNLIYFYDNSQQELIKTVLQTQQKISSYYAMFPNLNFYKIVFEKKDKNIFLDMKIINKKINLIAYDKYVYYYYKFRSFNVYERYRKVLIGDKVYFFDLITKKYKLLYDISNYISRKYSYQEANVNI